MVQHSDSRYFSRELFKFLGDLSRNNNRGWFTKNTPRYEKALFQPSLQFIKDAGERLKEISPYLVADPKPFGGSLFRIYRDTRFSKDKSPYKTHVAMEFWHKRRSKNVYGPGLYLRLATRQGFAGAGIWHPDPTILNKIRKAIVAKPEDWRMVRESGLKLEGDSLKRPPVGFDENLPFIEDLKLKSFTAGFPFRDSQVTGPSFLEDFLQAGKKLDPLNRFLATALALPW